MTAKKPMSQGSATRMTAARKKSIAKAQSVAAGKRFLKKGLV